MGNNKGEFTLKYTYNIIRSKSVIKDWLTNIWVKGVPFKLSFFHSDIWKGRISTNDNLKRMKMNIVYRCYCCESYKKETVGHLFITTPKIQKFWS